MELNFDFNKKTALMIILGVLAVPLAISIIDILAMEKKSDPPTKNSITYPQDQIDFENTWEQLSLGVEKADKGANDYMYREAIENRKIFLQSNGLEIKNWILEVVAVSEGLSSDCEIECWGSTWRYDYGHYYLNFNNIPVEKLKKLTIGTKIMVIGNRSTRYSFLKYIPSATITNGTFTILDQEI